MIKIIFVCTGNTCRSPMAEAIAKDIFEKNGIEAAIISRGLAVFSSEEVSHNSILALEKIGVKPIEHISTPLKEIDVKEADLILTMTGQHKLALLNFDPNLENKVFSLYEYVTGEQKDISDPFGGDEQRYMDCCNEIYGLIEKLAILLKQKQNN